MVLQIVLSVPLLLGSTRVKRNRHGPLKYFARRRLRKKSPPLFAPWDRERVILDSLCGSRHNYILMVGRLPLFARRKLKKQRTILLATKFTDRRENGVRDPLPRTLRIRRRKDYLNGGLW